MKRRCFALHFNPLVNKQLCSKEYFYLSDFEVIFFLFREINFHKKQLYCDY